MDEQREDEIEASVMDICGEGKNRFAVTYPTRPANGFLTTTSITLSFSEWRGDMEPLKGQIVLLSNIQRFVKGWRARVARPIVAVSSEQ